MQKMACKEILEAVNGSLICGDKDLEIYSICTDSRKNVEGSLFVPLKGEKFDGHKYISEVFSRKASACITEEDIDYIENKTVIKVKDTKKALIDIARYYRNKFKNIGIAITGSVGKTTTKDMIASVLSQKYNCLKTIGNFNNEIGVPLTIFNIDSSHEVAVIEMGMSGFGEIKNLTSILSPDIAVITNIGISHVETLGSKENILKAKLEVVKGLKDNGKIILNGDDEMLYAQKDKLSHEIIYYGIYNENVDYRAENIRSEGEKGVYFDIVISDKKHTIHVPAPGEHNVYNALSGIAVGKLLDLHISDIKYGIKNFSLGSMRLNILSINGIKIINDSYNASPDSMFAAINVLDEISGDNRKIAILGDMLELGEFAMDAHMEVGRFAFSKKIDYIITVGKMGKYIAKGAITAGADSSKVISFEDVSSVKDFISKFVQKSDVILIKGSRGMKMEGIISEYGL